MGFSMSHDSSGGYAYMSQQMSAQSGVSVNEYSTAVPTPTYPAGNYVSSHHHQVALQVLCIYRVLILKLIRYFIVLQKRFVARIMESQN